jgi:hypothetical protein
MRKLPPLGEYSEPTAKSKLQSKIAFRAALLDRISATCKDASITTLMRIATMLEEKQ